VSASRTLALLLVAAGLVSGCGAAATTKSAKNFSGAQKDVATTIDDLQSAASKSDQAKICKDLLAGSLISTIQSGGQTCTTAISHALDDADTFNMTVKSVTVNGTTATAVVDSKHKSTPDTFRLVNEGGTWKIASFGG
jgi:outer membrane lipoprotein-sorting protein